MRQTDCGQTIALLCRCNDLLKSVDLELVGRAEKTDYVPTRISSSQVSVHDSFSENQHALQLPLNVVA